MCITIVCFPSCDVTNFEFKLLYEINQAIFLHEQKVKTKV